MLHGSKRLWPCRQELPNTEAEQLEGVAVLGVLMPFSTGMMAIVVRVMEVNNCVALTSNTRIDRHIDSEHLCQSKWYARELYV